MNSNMVNPERFDHLHLVYHFTVPLNKWIHSSQFWQFDSNAYDDEMVCARKIEKNM